MRIKNFFVYQVIFLILIFYQTYSIATFKQNVDLALSYAQNATFVGTPLSLFTFGALALVFYSLLSFRYLKNEPQENRWFVKAIFLYVAYQILIILPLSYLRGADSIVVLQGLIVSRLAVLLIPFFLWFILPSFKKVESLFFWLNLSTIVLIVIAYYNYASNIIFTTNTGQMRLLWGGVVLIFATVFFINFFRQQRSLKNYFFIFLSVLGVITVNHRSAYIALFLIVLLGILLYSRERSRIKTITASLLIIVSVFFILAQNGVIWENFSQRIESISLQDANVQGRFYGWKLAYEHFKDSPINGSVSRSEYYQTMYYDQLPPHSFIFEILSTQGIIGLAFYLYLLVYPLLVAYNNRKDEISLQMLLVLLFYIFYALFNMTLLHPWNMLIMVLAISIILFRNNKLTTKPNPISY